MIAQCEIAMRQSPWDFAMSFMEGMEAENPELYGWLMQVGGMVEEGADGDGELLRSLWIANLGIAYNSIKAQIEANDMEEDLAAEPKDSK